MAKFNLKICSAVVACSLAMSAALTGCNGIFSKTETSNSSDNTSSQTSTVNGEVTSKFGDNIAVKSENFAVSLAIMHHTTDLIRQKVPECSTMTRTTELHGMTSLLTRQNQM